ncbi:MAG: hypothetical protein LBC26_05845, partial [Oscillospiraceae bacterium]|nr:hypothetical protein [Oscillospiraceae bacterium]
MRKTHKIVSAALVLITLVAMLPVGSLPVQAASLTPPSGYSNIESTDFENPTTDIFGIASAAGLENPAANYIAPTNATTSVGTGADANATRKLSWVLSNVSGNRHAVKTLSTATKNGLNASDEALISFDWYPGSPNSTNRGEIRFENNGAILLALVAASGGVGYHTGPTGNAQTILPTGQTSLTQWYTVNIYLRKGANIQFDIGPKNNAGAAYTLTANTTWTGALNSIQIQAIRLSNVTWTTYIDNIGLYQRNIAPATFSAAANGDAETSTSQITLTLSTAVAGLTAANITLTPAGAAVIGTPATSDGGTTWTVPVSGIVAGAAAVGVQVPGYAFTASPADADKITLYAGATALYEVSANGSPTETSNRIDITFDKPVAGLTAADITLSPAGAAEKGVLTGSDKNWSLQLFNAQAGEVAVAIGNIPNFVIVPHTPGVSDRTVLSKRPPDVVKFSAAADGDAGAKVQSTQIDITFDTAVTGLTAAAVGVSPDDAVVKGALTGGGTSWTLALTSIAVTKEIRLSIADFADYTFVPAAADADRTTVVYVKPDLAFTGNEWNTNSSTNFVFQLGGENPRSHYYLYDTEAKAKDNFTLYPFADEAGTVSNSASILPLNGTWKFHFAVNPGQRPWPTAGIGQAPRDFHTLGFDAGAWDDITVPNSWQVNFNDDGTAKYDQVQYVNSKNAWQYYHSGNTTSAPAAPVNYNGVGTYQRHFTVPADWDGKEVFLNFDGVSACYVWINGRAVGWTTDIWTHHEFDVTPYINVGDNVIALQLIRWTSGSWLENQDMVRLSGIARKTYLMARNAEDIWDFEVATRPVSPDDLNNGRDTAWTFDMKAAVRDFSDPTRTSGTSKPVH